MCSLKLVPRELIDFTKIPEEVTICSYKVEDVKKDENSFVHLMLKERIVNELVIKTLIDQEIKKKHIKVSK